MLTTQPIRVLVADHDRWTRLVIANMLADAGFAVHEATNGMQAVRTAARELPHILVLAPALPEINPAKVVQTIRCDPRTRGTAVVELTATTSAIELLALVVSTAAKRAALVPGASEQVRAADRVLARADSEARVGVLVRT